MCPLRGRRSRGPRLAALGIGVCRGLHRAAPGGVKPGYQRRKTRGQVVGGRRAGTRMSVAARSPVQCPAGNRCARQMKRPGAGPDRRATPPSDHRTASRRHRRPRRVRVVPVAPADEEPRRWPWVRDGDRGGSTWRPSPLRSLPRPVGEQHLRIAVSIGPGTPWTSAATSPFAVTTESAVTVIPWYGCCRGERPCLRHPGRAGRQARGQVNNSRLPNEPSQQRSPNNWHRCVSGMAPMSESAAGDR